MEFSLTIPSSEEQYNAIRDLLRCGHVYATLAPYENAFRIACKNFECAGTSLEESRWGLTCEAINAVAELLFEDEWREKRRQICQEVMAPLAVKAR